MPPKKGDAGKKKDKKKQDGASDESDELKEKLAVGNREIEALQRMLVLRTEEAQRARAEQDELAQQIREFHELFEKERAERYSITCDMTRQYKNMQDVLLERINDLEEGLNNLRDQLDYSRVALEQAKLDKKRIIDLKQRQIDEQKQKMEDMAVEFGNMLKNTLDRMNTRMEANARNLDAEESFLVGRREIESDFAKLSEKVRLPTESELEELQVEMQSS